MVLKITGKNLFLMPFFTLLQTKQIYAILSSFGKNICLITLITTQPLFAAQLLTLNSINILTAEAENK
jgi:hypothetical protein